MIEEAQPKQGLETGGLVSGSEAARARVALNYEDDLAGKNGPTARFDTLRELIGAEISAALNEMRFTSGDGTGIFGREGSFAVETNPKTRGKGFIPDLVSSVLPYWSLEVVDAEAGTVKLANPGILKRTNALDSSGILSIVDVTSYFRAIAGRLLCLVIEPDMTVTLDLVSTWTGWPYPYEVEESTPEGLWIWTKYYYPLWDFRSTASTELGTVKINDSLFAEKRGFDTHLFLDPVERQSSTGPVIATYEIIPSIGARRT